MRQQGTKLFLLAGMALLSLCLIAACFFMEFTYARYEGGSLDEDSTYDDVLDFIGANQYLVRTPEELIDAIENGYSYIQIAENAEKPFVISTGVTGVSSNLMLDLNGTQIIRNSRNPILDIGDGISVVLMYDTKGGGALYNPVGSALQVSGQTVGGRMTVASGSYESGPRAGEYDNADGRTGGIISNDDKMQVQVHVRSSAYSGNTLNTQPSRSNQDDYQTMVSASMPRITMGSSTGNYYRPLGSFNEWIVEDTFLLYTEEELAYEEDGVLHVGSNALAVLCDVASCDFYYYYPLEGAVGSVNAPVTYAVVYGYWNTKSLAQTQDTAITQVQEGTRLQWPYAAVRMTDSRGEGYVRGGDFVNHFELENTYGIYTRGGSLTVSGATTRFMTGKEGVCISCNGGTLDISGGTFSSERGNTVQMQGGTMRVSAGTFEKDASAFTDEASNGAAIDVKGGSLTVAGSENGTKSVAFHIRGSHVYGIHMNRVDSGETETDSIYHVAFKFAEGSNNIGVYAEGGITTATDCIFTLPGSNNAGIYAEGGVITATDCEIDVLGNKNNFGIHTIGQQVQITATGCTIQASGTNSSGIYAEGGSLTIDGGSVKATLPEAETALSTTAVSTVGGSIALGGTLNILSNALGITAQSAADSSDGDIHIVSGAAVTVAQAIEGDSVTPMRATGIYINNGTLVVADGGSVDVYVSIQSELTWGSGAVNQNNGVFVQGGALESYGTLNVTFTGVAKDGNADPVKSYAVYVESSQAHAAQLGMVAGTILSKQGGGIYAGGGNITLGHIVTSNEETGGALQRDASAIVISTDEADGKTYAAGIFANGGTIDITTTVEVKASALGMVATGGTITIGQLAEMVVIASRATGIYVHGGSIQNNGTLTVESRIDAQDSSAGADLDEASRIQNRYNGIFINAGSLISEGTLNVTFVGVENDAHAQGGTYQNQVTKSFAVRVEAPENTAAENTRVLIAGGAITNSVGGGVLVSGGTVILGNDAGGPTVQTTGTAVYDNVTLNPGTGSNWYYYWNKTGGDAIKAIGGTLIVHGGAYTAAQGNGILVDGGSTTISGGTFDGKQATSPATNNGVTAGPAGHYGFKTLISGNTNITGGTFQGANGGAFTMGSSSSYVNVSVSGNAAFSGETKNGFTIFDYSSIDFSGDYVVVEGADCAIAVNKIDAASLSEIKISAGRYTASNRDGIWYNHGNAKLTISGGTISGAVRAGIYLDTAATVTNAIVISNGMIIGNRAGLYIEEMASATSSIVISGGTIRGDDYGIYYGAQNKSGNDLLVITGGVFEGTGSSGIGLYFQQNPWHDDSHFNVCILGGVFQGTSSAMQSDTGFTIGSQSIFQTHVLLTVNGGTIAANTRSGWLLGDDTQATNECLRWFRDGINQGGIVNGTLKNHKKVTITRSIQT